MTHQQHITSQHTVGQENLDMSTHGRNEESKLFDISMTPTEINKQTPSFEDKLMSPAGQQLQKEKGLNFNQILNEANEDEDL